MWFRVELNKDGSVSDVRAIEQCRSEGKFVRYVEAVSKAEACKRASEWWDKWQEKQRQIILEREREREARRDERDARDAEVQRKVNKAQAIAAAAAKKVSAKADLSLDERTLREVLRVFDQTPRTFRKWVGTQLKAKVAAQNARRGAEEKWASL